MDIVYLADVPHLIPALARWFREDWPLSSERDRAVADADPEADFRGSAQKSSLPLGLVAMDGEAPIGTVSILRRAFHADPGVGPWIQGLYVVPERRHRGIALSLVEAAIAVAGALGYDRILIGTRAGHAGYETRGWRFEGVQQHPEGAITVLSIASRGSRART